jgi:hypothetical protein
MTLQPKEVNFETTFKLFKYHLDAIFLHRKFPIHGMDIYQLTFDCCTAYPEPYSEQLLKAILSFLTDFCASITKEIIDSDNPITVYAQKWKAYNQAAFFLSTACEYLNRQLKQQSNLSKTGAIDTLLRMSLLSVILTYAALSSYLAIACHVKVQK